MGRARSSSWFSGPHSTADSIAQAKMAITKGLEALWLALVVLIPLAYLHGGDVLGSPVIFFGVVPKLALLRAGAALMAALWLAEWALQAGFPAFRVGPPALASVLPRTKRWLQDRPGRWLHLAGGLFFFSTLLSTIFSASPGMSLWGEVPGQDGYPLYTVACYLVLFAVIATHLKTASQVHRLMGAVILSGGLVAAYGVLQHLGHDFLSLMAYPGTQRITSTTGNATFAAACILLTMPMTLAAAVATLNVPLKGLRFWSKAIPWSFLLAVQAAGMAFTLSRGPWVGGAAALAVFLGLAALRLPARILARTIVVVALAVIFTVFLINLPVKLSPVPGGTDVAGGGGDVAGRLASIGSEVVEGGLNNRLQIWSGSWQLMLHHPWFEFDSLHMGWVRPLLGYGPELFRSTYLLESRPVGPELQVLSGHAHNYFIHQGVELGFLGLAAALALFGALLPGALAPLFQRKRGNAVMLDIVTIGVLAALAGRSVEQLVGVARVSDLTLFWSLLAITTALPAALSLSQTGESGRNKAARTTHRLSPAAGTLWPRLAVALVAALALGWLTWAKTINYALAAGDVNSVNGLVRQGDLAGALASADKAIELAPDVFVFYNYQATLFSIYQSRSGGERPPQCAREPAGQSYRICLARQAYLANREGVARRPLHFRAHLALADSAAALAALDLDSKLVHEAAQEHQKAASMAPYLWTSWVKLGALHIQFGQPQQALAALDRALAITGNTTYAAGVLVFRGLAYQDIGQPAQALADFDRAIGINPKLALAYYHRALLYTTLGKDADAEGDAAQVALLGGDPASGVDAATLREQMQALKDQRAPSPGGG
ncbi:MAG: hypothetical protein FJ316_03555 [SAR202 cluster bacterium]|nr:hypothetical protein [SAR202 cluster bacterium]